jgi:anti-anti-sigma factor
MEVLVQTSSNQIVTVAPQGRFDAFNAPMVRQIFDQLLVENLANFVIDLTNISFLDSAGMAVLVGLLKQARQNKGNVKLVWPQEEAACRILSLTRFDKVFEMVTSVETGIASF